MEEKQKTNDIKSFLTKFDKLGDSFSRRTSLTLVYVAIAIIGIYFILNTIKLYRVFFE